MPRNIDISVVVPVYDEKESLPELCDWIQKVMQSHGFSYEMILVDDGSQDGSWELIENLSESNHEIKGIRLNRNYGKSAALDTGFKNVSGNVIVTLDADMQDSPDEIPELYRMITEDGFDLVSGWKKKRHDPISKTIPSKFFNLVTRKISKIKLHDFNCGLKAYKSDVVKTISVYGEMHRYIPVIAKWNGYSRIGEKVVQHQERKYGRTKFGMERFITGFLDLVSITFVMRFIKKPMHFFGTIGTLSFLMGFFITLWLIGVKIYRLNNQLPVREITEQPLFYIALVAVILGSQMFLAGFLAEMITINSDKTSRYIIADRKGF